MTDRFHTFIRLGQPLGETVLATLGTARDRYGKLGASIARPAITSRWFTIRETVAAIIAPPIPLGAPTEIRLTDCAGLCPT